MWFVRLLSYTQGVWAKLGEKDRSWGWPWGCKSIPSKRETWVRTLWNHHILILRTSIKAKITPERGRLFPLKAGFSIELLFSFPYPPFLPAYASSPFSPVTIRYQALSQISTLLALLLTLCSLSPSLRMATKGDYCLWTTSLLQIPATSLSSN